MAGGERRLQPLYAADSRPTTPRYSLLDVGEPRFEGGDSLTGLHAAADGVTDLYGSIQHLTK